MANSNVDDSRGGERLGTGKNWHLYLGVLLVAGAVYLGCIVSPPSLMDDVDAVQAQIARNMLTSGDWVTARLDGVAYLEKAPLIYWVIALSYKVFGVHDWAARIPVALSAWALAWLTAAFGVWAFGRRAGFYAGLCMATCIGLFLFTRVLIPDVMLTFTVALAMWAFLRALDEEEPHPRFWAFVLAASLGVGLLLKSLIGVVFPVGAGVDLSLADAASYFPRRPGSDCIPSAELLIVLLIAAPWHVLATLRNPPYFAFTLHSGPGEYHGFLWFFFINEQVLRFLNLRYPRDYNTVPRLYFWLFHLLWLFPWSVYFPAVAKLSFKPVGSRRADAPAGALLDRLHPGLLHFLDHAGILLDAVLSGAGAAAGLGHGRRRRYGCGGARACLRRSPACAALAGIAILFLGAACPAPGDISSALAQHPERLHVVAGPHGRPDAGVVRLSALAAGHGGIGLLCRRSRNLQSRRSTRSHLSRADDGIFFHAARVAMVAFDPYLSSRPLAEAILNAPAGTLIVDHHYYTFSSIFFYTNRSALLLNGRFKNLEYGAYAPGAPDVFIDDAQFTVFGTVRKRPTSVAKESAVPRLESWWAMTNCMYWPRVAANLC